MSSTILLPPSAHLCIYLLFLQEQIKGIIILGTAVINTTLNVRFSLRVEMNGLEEQADNAKARELFWKPL
jgi:hypothetical protein